MRPSVGVEQRPEVDARVRHSKEVIMATIYELLSEEGLVGVTVDAAAVLQQCVAVEGACAGLKPGHELQPQGFSQREEGTTQLTRVVAGGPADPERAPLRAGLLATQVLGVAVCRYILQLEPVTRMTREEVVSWLGPTLQQCAAGAR